MNWHPPLLGCLADPFAQAARHTCSETAAKRVHRSAGPAAGGEGQQLCVWVYRCQRPVVLGEVARNHSRARGWWEAQPRTGAAWNALLLRGFWKSSFGFSPFAARSLHVCLFHSVTNITVLLMWENSDHLSLPGLMAGIGWASCVQLLILWSRGFLFAGPCRNQVSTVPVNVVTEQNCASHCCGSSTKPISSVFSSVFCKAHHWVCSFLLVIVHQLN